jgi:hypothetical protein
MDKAFVAKGVATQLWVTEAAIDTALAEASKLMGSMVDARREMGLAASVGNDAFAKVAEASAALAAARTAAVEAHASLAREAKALRVERAVMGPGSPTKTEPIKGEVRDERAA